MTIPGIEIGEITVTAGTVKKTLFGIPSRFGVWHTEVSVRHNGSHERTFTVSGWTKARLTRNIELASDIGEAQLTYDELHRNESPANGRDRVALRLRIHSLRGRMGYGVRETSP